MNKNNQDKAEVKILGEKYVIKGDEPGDYISELGDFIDQRLKQIREYNPSVSRLRLMVLGLMYLADKLYKIENKNEKLEKDYNKIKEEYQDLLSEYQELKENYQSLDEEYNEFLELLEEGGFE